MSNFATFLGTGSSLGIPVVGCPCEVCHSKNLKNHRYRSSLLLEVMNKKIVIDAGPDFRQQALRANINHLDGVIFTHAHQDHVAGIDDLRVFSFKNKASLPCLVSDETAKELLFRYFFMFKPQNQEAFNYSRLTLINVKNKMGQIDFLGVPIHYFSYDQVGMQVLGVRIGSFAYVTDIKKYSEEIFEALKDVKTLVLSALRFTHSNMHLTVDEALDFIQKVGCEQAYLTHISHDMEHEKANAYLPSSVELAYDGLKIPFE